MTVLYAAYGSNLHPARLSRRLASATLRGTAFLSGWSLQFHKRSLDGSGKCSIRRGSDGVHIAIYAMRVTERLLLDQIEGLGAGYDGVDIDVPGIGTCFSYTAATTHIDDALEPYDWYRQLVLAGAEFHGFPADYVARIGAVRARRDPDTGRHEQMWQLVKSVEMQGLDLAGQRITTPAE